ncbi:MAG: heme-binding protein [Pseudomonadota bacterium]
MNAVAIGLGATLAVAGIAGFVASRAAADVEEPAFELEQRDGAFEIRAYPDLVVASVARDGSRRQAVQQGFGPLARYIFARDREGDKIAMTAPVLQSTDEAGWTVSFIMPAGMALEDLPDAGADVRLEDLPARRMAVYRFSGRWSDGRFAEAVEALEGWLAVQGLEAAGAPEYAYYNDPFTPAFMRRNEVMIELAP